ncbi:MAG: hypothetical protein FWH03_08445 [Firmicutes bacterium]|nr:hypothetical protein [Bacillota bacterium]
MAKGVGKSFAVAMLIVGSIVGAGFVSGRELVSFFGSGISPLIAIPCAVFIFILSVLFLFIGSRLNAKNISEVNVKLAGRFHFVTDVFILVNNLIVLAGMLAAADSLGEASIASLAPLYSIIFGVLCVLAVLKGVKGMLNINKAAVPVMAATVVFVAIFTLFAHGSGGAARGVRLASIGAAAVYVCMNMMLASTVITTLGKMNKKTILLSSAIAALLMGALVCMLILALNARGQTNADMPVLDMAKAIHPSVYWIMIAVLAVSIFTTMLVAMGGLVSWFEGLFGKRFFSAVLILGAAFILSNLGFSNVVRFLYPVIGALGVIYTLLGLIFAAKTLPLKPLLKRRPKPTR